MSPLLGQLWRWPMHSPRRLLVTLLVLVALVAGVAALTTSPGRPSAAPAPAPSTTAPATVSPTPTPDESSAEPSPTSSKDYGQALTVARDFVTAWSSHQPDFQVWYASVAVMATDKLAARLATVDPDNIGATGVTGPLRLTDTGSTARTEVAVPTNTGLVSVTMLLDRDGVWRVSDIEPGAQTEAG
ncbi:hypothetical protein [Streptomyces sp. NPDC048623]|uniref:hypothetical protein n=1 Tax=Streptomyces sp. NPDC048623 TaxID=3155761 RepID=UPI00343B0AD8